MAAYYNEIDPFAAQWLRNLIAAGHIAPGEVDERSIVDVQPGDLRGFTQCHFFAGIGGWSLALRMADWDDRSPVWTGSCPCQPFSVAGAGRGTSDDRHLWPDLFRLIRECRPPVVFGEQVEAAIRHGWLDLVSADLEGIGYAFAAAGLPAASVGAPHIRQRLWFVAHAREERFDEHPQRDREAQRCEPVEAPRRDNAGRCGVVGDADHARLEVDGQQSARQERQTVERAGWADLEWLPCRDGKARPTQPAVQWMADGLPEVLVRLRPDQLQAFAEEVNAKISEAERGQAVFDLWLSLAEETLQYPTRGLRSVQEAPLLLAFLCELSDQGWNVPKGIPFAGQESARRIVRMLRDGEPVAGSPRQRGLAGQLATEPSNAVRVLSSILAFHAQANWGETLAANARAVYPLASGVSGRVGRLRAYGNAIVAPLAAAFIEAYLTCRP